MGKTAKAFQMPVEDRDEIVAPSSPAPKLAEVAPEPPAAIQAPSAPASASSRPAYREGRRNLSVWLDQKAFNSFKAMVAEEGSTIQDYVIEMVNREFARKGRPQIAK